MKQRYCVTHNQIVNALRNVELRRTNNAALYMYQLFQHLSLSFSLYVTGVYKYLLNFWSIQNRVCIRCRILSLFISLPSRFYPRFIYNIVVFLSVYNLHDRASRRSHECHPRFLLADSRFSLHVAFLCNDDSRTSFLLYKFYNSIEFTI